MKWDTKMIRMLWGPWEKGVLLCRALRPQR